MTWVKLDEAFGEHPKIVGLSDSALALWVTGLGYCNRNLTDGFIPSAVGFGQLRYCEGNAVPAVRELERSGAWEIVPGGWHVHDYEDYQPSKEAVLAEREASRKRQEKSRQGKAATTPAVTKVSRRDKHRSSNAAVAVAVPGSEPQDPNLSSPSRHDLFAVFYAAYPRHEARSAGERAYLKALDKGVPPAQILKGAERFRDDPNREAEFTPLPALWLNAGRWDDDPLPARTNGHQPDESMSERIRRVRSQASA